MSKPLAITRIGQYDLREVVGQGGMGTVYRARRPGDDRDLAIKVLPADYAAHPLFLRSFEQEFQISIRLKHSHILPVHEAGIAEAGPFIVMDYMPGGSLAQQMTMHPGGMRFEDIVRITSQVASALNHAHQSGVIHRDVKPGNILLDRRGDAYLSDFGVVHLVGQVRQALGHHPGTPPYAAPELARGEQPTSASDLYALGATVFEMITGRAPSLADSRDQPAVSGGPADPCDVTFWRPHAPGGLKVVMQQVLHPVPSSRPASALAFAQTLAAACWLSDLHEVLVPLSMNGNGHHSQSYLDEIEGFNDIPGITPQEEVSSHPLTPLPATRNSTPPPFEEATVPTLKPVDIPTVPHAPVAMDRGTGYFKALIGTGLSITLIVLFVLVMLSFSQGAPY
nr:serine/threonine protein kinase [Anaerolineae bacterium]